MSDSLMVFAIFLFSKHSSYVLCFSPLHHLSKWNNAYFINLVYEKHSLSIIFMVKTCNKYLPKIYIYIFLNIPNPNIILVRIPILLLIYCFLLDAKPIGFQQWMIPFQKIAIHIFIHQKTIQYFIEFRIR